MTTSDALSEKVRICAQRIAECGAPALSGLYDLTSMRLVRFAVTITRNQHDAEDAVQTALLRVATKVDLVLQSDKPWCYLLRMVRNEAIVVLRKKKRWSIVDNLTDLVTRRTVDQLEQEDTFRKVWLALRALPIEQREVVVLKIWEELTFAQIGELLDMPLATVASRYRYALTKLAGPLRSLSDETQRNEVKHG
jgi:RNA polymerase sigma-70 factor, ECF subfamily